MQHGRLGAASRARAGGLVRCWAPPRLAAERAHRGGQVRRLCIRLRAGEQQAAAGTHTRARLVKDGGLDAREVERRHDQQQRVGPRDIEGEAGVHDPALGAARQAHEGHSWVHRLPVQVRVQVEVADLGRRCAARHGAGVGSEMLRQWLAGRTHAHQPVGTGEALMGWWGGRGWGLTAAWRQNQQVAGAQEIAGVDGSCRESS
jgi:hypothetical protein